MSYSEKVIEHYENPKNVGSLDKDDPQVGTGLVGAPECFGGQTIVAVPDRKHISLEEAFEENKVFPVWSFNIKEGRFEIKNARAICTGKKLLHSIKINNSVIWVTPDHEFYTIKKGYVKNCDIDPSMSIRSFERVINRRGYWSVSLVNGNKEEYLSLYRFNSGRTDSFSRRWNVDHLDGDKRNDLVENLHLLPVDKHAFKTHAGRLRGYNKIKAESLSKSVSKEDVLRALDSNDGISHLAANDLCLYMDDYYLLACFYGIRGNWKCKTRDDLRVLSSERMKKENPYHGFSEEQKKAFATHNGSENGRWIDVSNEELIKIGSDLFHEHGKFTAAIWQDYAKSNGLPQGVSNSSRFDSFSEFKEKVISYNHRMEIIGDTKEDLCYTLQVEENNNYVVITDIRLNDESGIVVRNCGDVMKLQIKVNDEGVIEDAVFKSYGCGSAIASSSLATEWVKGKTIEEAESISNVDIVEELSLPPVKIHCSVLAEDSIKAAIADYRAKQSRPE